MCVLESERLILRPPRPSDIPAITVWLGDYDVAKNLSRVPYPYDEGDAENFIALHAAPSKASYTFAILRKVDGIFMGMVGLNDRGEGWELGYWLGKPFWRLGHASEAARRLTAFAFEMLEAPSIWAGWYHDNPASGHVLAKLGARHAGSKMLDCKARGGPVLCHGMRLTRADFLRKQAA